MRCARHRSLFLFLRLQSTCRQRLLPAVLMVWGTEWPQAALFYAFPTLEQLTDASEEDLRAAGFGYRARFVVQTVAQLRAQPGGGAAWLHGLRDVPYSEATEALCTLPGVGPKVLTAVLLRAEACGRICTHTQQQHDLIMARSASQGGGLHLPLFAGQGGRSTRGHSRLAAGGTALLAPPARCAPLRLQSFGTCPVLVEIGGIAAVAGKKPSKAQNRVVEEALQERFGSHAGWAHNVLFISELAQMRHLLPGAASAQLVVAEATAEACADPAQSAEERTNLEAPLSGRAGPPTCSASAELLVSVSCAVRAPEGGDQTMAVNGAGQLKTVKVEAGTQPAGMAASAVDEAVGHVRSWRRRRLQ